MKKAFTFVWDDNPLLLSETKYDSKTGWPSFGNQFPRPRLKPARTVGCGVCEPEVICTTRARGIWGTCIRGWPTHRTPLLHQLIPLKFQAADTDTNKAPFLKSSKITPPARLRVV